MTATESSRERASRPAGDDDAFARLGRQLRRRRRDAGLTMRDVVERSGISQPFLSQIERGEASPSLTTLFALAECLGTTPEALLSFGVGHNEDEVSVVRSSGGHVYRVTDEQPSATRRVVVDGPPFTVSEYTAERGASFGGFYRSTGVELIYVQSGRLVVALDNDDRHELATGDSIRYPSRLRHRWIQLGAGTTRFLHVITSQPGSGDDSTAH